MSKEINNLVNELGEHAKLVHSGVDPETATKLMSWDIAPAITLSQTFIGQHKIIVDSAKNATQRLLDSITPDNVDMFIKELAKWPVQINMSITGNFTAKELIQQSTGIVIKFSNGAHVITRRVQDLPFDTCIAIIETFETLSL